MAITNNTFTHKSAFYQTLSSNFVFSRTAGLYRDIRSEEALSSCCAFVIIFQGCFIFIYLFIFNQSAPEQRTIVQC